MRFFPSFVVLLMLAGCGSSLDALRLKNPQGDSLGANVAAEYLAYAESEAEWQHPGDAERAAAKGLRALEGEALVLDVPADRYVPSDRLPEAEAVYARIQLLTKDERLLHTETATLARLVVMYDCWLEQFSKAYEPTCGDEMNALLGVLEQQRKKMPRLIR